MLAGRFVDKSKQIDFDDIIMLWKILHLTEEELHSIGNSNKAHFQKMMKFEGIVNNELSKLSKVFLEEWQCKRW